MQTAADAGFEVEAVLATHLHQDHVGGDLFGQKIPGVAELLQELLDLEMPRDLAEATVDFEVTRLELRLPPPPPEPEPFFETPEGKLRVRILREAFRDIAITEEDLRTGLVALEMPAPQARAFAALEVQRLIEPPPPPPPPPPLFYQTPAGTLRLREILALFRAERLSPAELLQELLELEMPFELAEATRDFEATRLELRLPLPPPGPGPFFETPEGKLRVKTLREAFRGELIADVELLDRLLLLEMPPGQARAFVTFEAVRRQVRARER